MKPIAWLAAGALVAVPLLADTAPAGAATANQYRAQGRGVYLNSKGHPKGGFRHYGYGYRPDGYGYRPYGYGYRPYGCGYRRPYGYGPYGYGYRPDGYYPY